MGLFSRAGRGAYIEQEWVFSFKPDCTDLVSNAW